MLPPVAGRFVAGETTAEAIDHAASLNDRDVGAILNLLGEHYDERVPADDDAETYCQLVADIDDADVDACISVKPSQLGLDVGDDVFRENVGHIVDAAADHDVFVWLDMKDHTTTDPTLDAFEHHAREYDAVGICLQANLRRTPDDLERFVDVPGKIRLVKGAYDPPADVAYRDSERVNEAYRDCLDYMFAHYDGGIAVGSHDPAMIDYARDLHDEYGTPFEVQMLMGVREDAQTELASDVPVWQYVPYGSKWLSYFYRRVAERKENVLFALRALVS
jgi:proline dehydrogenase